MPVRPNDTNRGGADSSSEAFLELMRRFADPEAARTAGFNFADSFVEGAGSQASAATAMGSKLGSNIIKSISSAVGSGLSSLMTSIGGSLEIGKSFTSGTQLASTIRTEMARYSIGNRNLQAFSEAIKDAYSGLKQDGITVDPNIIYGMYRQLGSLVSLTGSSEARLTSLLNVATKISQSSGQLNTGTYSSDYFLNTFGAESLELINGLGASMSQYSKNWSDSLQQAVINNQDFAYQVMKSSKNQEDISRSYEKFIESTAYIADQTNATTAKAISDLTARLMGPNVDFASLFGEGSGNAVFGNYINQALRAAGMSESITNINKDWMAQNSDVLMQAITSASIQMGSQFGDSIEEVMKRLGMSALSPTDLAVLNSSSTALSKTLGGATDAKTIMALLNQGMGSFASGQSLPGSLDAVYQAIDKQNTVSDRLNSELKLIGLDLVDDTYNNQVLGWLAVIGNGIGSLIGGAGGAGGILSSLFQGTTTGVVSGLMTGGGAAGAAAGGGGLLGVLGTAGPIALGVAAAGAISYAIIDAVKQGQEESNKAMEDMVKPFLESKNVLISIDELTGQINSKIEEPKDQNAGANTYENIEYDASTGKISISNTALEAGETVASRQARNAALITSSVAKGGSAANAFYQNYKTGEYTTYDKLYQSYQSGALSYDEFMLSMGSGKTGLLGTGYSQGGAPNFTFHREEQVIPVEYRAAELFRMLEGASPAFAELLGLYTGANLLTQNGSSIFDWDNSTRDFVYNFPEYYKRYVDKREVKTTDGRWVVLPTVQQPLANSFSGDWLGDNYIDELGLATGLDNIPFDGYWAKLHEGEMVIPAKRANFLRRMFGMQPQNFSNVPANKSNGMNSFVQGIPEFAAGVDDPYLLYKKASASTQGRMNPMLEKLLLDMTVANNQPYLQVSWGRRPLDETRGARYSMHKLGLAADVQGWGRNIPESEEIKWGLLRYAHQRGNPSARASDGWERWHYAPLEIYNSHNDGTYSLKAGFNALKNQYPLGEYADVPDGTKISYSDLGATPAFTSADGTESVTDLNQIPENFENLVKYKHYPFIAEKLRRLGYGDSSTSTLANSNANYTADNSAYQNNQYRNIIDKYASQYGINPLLLYGIMMTESSGNPNANRDKATQYKGLMQLNQAKVDAIGGGDIFDPDTNIHAGSNYLKSAYNSLRYWTLAVGGYNHGPGYNAWDNLASLFDKGVSWDDAIAQVGVTSQMSGNYPKVKTSYINSVYEYAGLPKVGAYLAKGGIVTDPTVTMLGEGRDNEAVIPLNKNIDYLGIKELGINIIDALDIMTERICKRLDELISLKKEDGRNQINTILNNQRSQRLDAIVNFQGNY